MTSRVPRPVIASRSSIQSHTPRSPISTFHEGMNESSMDNQTARDSSSGPHRLKNVDLVRQFVHHLFNREAPRTLTDVDQTIDWDAIARAAAGAGSHEQEVGRSIVMADLMARGLYRPEPGGQGGASPDSGRRGEARAAVERLLSSARAAPSVVLASSVILVSLIVAISVVFSGSAPAAPKAQPNHGDEGNSQLVRNAIPTGQPVDSTTTTAILPPATSPPAPAPPSLADAPPLSPHEVFAFAPYWTLSQSAGFDVAHISTIAYFSIGVNADGSLNQSSPGWNGYQSQAFANLVTRAHSAGDRVVLTVNDFDQNSLDQLTSSSSAPATLATAVIAAIQAKRLDGVNFDFEGSGSGDQTGLTNLITQVSAAIHGADPNYQVTMDTYASSAGDSGGFYNIPALAPAVDAFFVMSYQLNLQSGASSVSPLTSTLFSEKTTVDQYTAVVPAAKVILGLPYFGIDWPTSDGTLTAQATGPATNVTYGQVVASGHPIYWDATTDTGWTSYQVGSQWHESFFEVPSSLYDAAQLATSHGLGGVGIWALGMDGNDPNMTSALAGLSPVSKGYSGGPTSTSSSPTTSTSTSTSTSSPSTTTSTTSSARPGSTTGSSSTTSSSPSSSPTSSSPGSTTSSSPPQSSTTETSKPTQTRNPRPTTTTSNVPASTSSTTPAPSP
jgi:hypothetical protein